MTLMALFKQPDVFKAGAALRPVTDWSQYNHEYTANILNTPELDPRPTRSPRRSNTRPACRTPADRARHDRRQRVLPGFGAADAAPDRAAKDNWELAPYPLERHGFTHPDSWYDEYRRILELFDATLQPGTPQPVAH